MNILPDPQWEAIAAVRAQLLAFKKLCEDPGYRRKIKLREFRRRRAKRPRARARPRPPVLRGSRVKTPRLRVGEINTPATPGGVDPPAPGEPVPIARILPHVLAQIARGTA